MWSSTDLNCSRGGRNQDGVHRLQLQVNLFVASIPQRAAARWRKTGEINKEKWIRVQMASRGIKIVLNREMRVAVATTCSKKKERFKLPAHMLYKSRRIKAVYSLGRKNVFILSAEHGLIGADKYIGPYNEEMNKTRCQELVPEVAKVVEDYDIIVYFKDDGDDLYVECMEKACNEAGAGLILFEGDRLMARESCEED